jgi:tryptophan 2,3-dioxygenase
MSDKQKDPYASIHYSNYLKLDQLLSAQELRSELVGKPAHDEMLFIIIHQVYELWFKQIQHELDSITNMFKSDFVDEKNIGQAIDRLDRIITILHLQVQQILVIETIKPHEFLDFRNYLFPASGFQSFQFRKVEVSLGLSTKNRITYNNKPYHIFFTDEQTNELNQIESNGSLLDEINKWLERTPFLQFNTFNFLKDYHGAVDSMIAREQENIRQNQFLSDEEKQMRLKMLGDTTTYFNSIFDEGTHNQLVSEGKLRFSYKATLAALFIKLYKEHPLLRLPNTLLERLLDIEELLTTWRFRHSQMVLRTLGKKIGTGGSSGHDYLFDTVIKHRIFTDLYNLATMMIPKEDLPALPEDLQEKLDFYYSRNK